MDSELCTKTLTHLSRYLLDLGLLGGCRPGGRHNQREVDIAPGASFPARDAAEDERLVNMVELRETSSEEPLQISLHFRLFGEEGMNPRIQDVPPVQLIEVGAARSLDLSYAKFSQIGQHLGGAVVDHIRASREISSTDRESFGKKVERTKHTDVPAARENIIESIGGAHSISKTYWYL